MRKISTLRTSGRMQKQELESILYNRLFSDKKNLDNKKNEYLESLGFTKQADEKKLIIPNDWSIQDSRVYQSILDFQKRIRVSVENRLDTLGPESIIVEPRFSLIDEGLESSNECSWIQTRVYDNKFVNKINEFHDFAISTIIYKTSISVEKNWSEEKIFETRKQEKEKLHKFMKEKYPDYKNPYAYWED